MVEVFSGKLGARDQEDSRKIPKNCQFSPHTNEILLYGIKKVKDIIGKENQAEEEEIVLDKGFVFTYGRYTIFLVEPPIIVMFGYKSFLELSKAMFMNVFTFLTLFIPRAVAMHVASILGICAFFALRGRRRAILDALRVIQPDADERMRVRLGCRVLINYANNFADFLRLHHMDTDELLGITRIEGIEHFWRALKEHNGAILLSAHLGNWEVGSNFIAATGLPLVGVAESAGPGEAFYQLFQRYRKHFGTTIFSLEDPSVGFKLRKRLKSGYIVGLIGDRDIAGSGVEVTYFGRKAVFPTGAAFLSLATKTPIIPAFYLRLNRSGKKVYYAYIEEPIPFTKGKKMREDVQRLTQIVAERVEAVVRKYPDQWFCFPPPWKGVGEGEKHT